MNSAISACEKSGCWAAALLLLASAKETTARPSVSLRCLGLLAKGACARCDKTPSPTTAA